MLKNCIKEIIEPMGFVNEGDNIDDRWVAQFLCDLTGNILTIVAEEINDEQGVPRVMFNVCDEEGNLVNTMTLDQLLVSYEQDLQLVPPKSRKSYIAVYKLRVQVPVDMESVTHKTFNNYVRDGYTTETEIAEQCARAKLRHCFSDVDLHLLGFECEQIEC